MWDHPFWSLKTFSDQIFISRGFFLLEEYSFLITSCTCLTCALTSLMILMIIFLAFSFYHHLCSLQVVFYLFVMVWLWVRSFSYVLGHPWLLHTQSAQLRAQSWLPSRDSTEGRCGSFTEQLLLSLPLGISSSVSQVCKSYLSVSCLEVHTKPACHLAVLVFTVRTFT